MRSVVRDGSVHEAKVNIACISYCLANAVLRLLQRVRKTL